MQKQIPPPSLSLCISSLFSRCKLSKAHIHIHTLSLSPSLSLSLSLIDTHAIAYLSSYRGAAPSGEYEFNQSKGNTTRHVQHEPGLHVVFRDPPRVIFDHIRLHRVHQETSSEIHANVYYKYLHVCICVCVFYFSVE
jgi:hypothetical protein